MKPINDDFLDEAEELARASMKVMKAFLTYQGDNPQLYHKAKIAAVGASNYHRLRATETNRMAVEHATQKGVWPATLPTGGVIAVEPPKRIGKGNGHAA